MQTLPTFNCELIKNDNGEFKTKTVNLADYVKQKNQGLILYFYPKDNTPGCNMQATDFSNDIERFAQLGYHIIGVSRDSTKTHQNFMTKQSLNIELVSDKDEQLCQYFDVIKEKNMYGKKVMGIVRSTFVFDKEGKLIYELRNVKSKEHSDKLYQLLSGNGNDSGIKF